MMSNRIFSDFVLAINACDGYVPQKTFLNFCSTDCLPMMLCSSLHLCKRLDPVTFSIFTYVPMYTSVMCFYDFDDKNYVHSAPKTVRGRPSGKQQRCQRFAAVSAPPSCLSSWKVWKCFLGVESVETKQQTPSRLENMSGLVPTWTKIEDAAPFCRSFVRHFLFCASLSVSASSFLSLTPFLHAAFFPSSLYFLCVLFLRPTGISLL